LGNRPDARDIPRTEGEKHMLGIIEGQRSQGSKQVLTELDLAYPGRIT
jgi:hypothetical protein